MPPRFFQLERFPLVVATSTSGEDAEHDVAEFYAEWDAVIARGPHAVLLDLTKVNPLFVGAHERRLIAAAAKDRREGFERTLIAEARLCRGPVVRAIMVSFDWLIGRPFEHPIAYFDHRETAERWLLERLATGPSGA